MKKIIKIIIRVILVLVIVFGGFLLYSTVTEYKPAEVENSIVLNRGENSSPILSEFSVLTWNIGYAALGKEADFFMDGGEQSRGESKAVIEKHLENIINRTKSYNADFIFIQEVDEKAFRSYNVPELDVFVDNFLNYSIDYVQNYAAFWVPVPLTHPMGGVKAGMVTLSKSTPLVSERYSLPGSYSWPTSIFQLDRCVIVNRYKMGETGKELVLVNIHLSAFDKGGFIRGQQLDFLKTMMLKEYNQGNYVVVGGDWNNIMTPDFSFGTYTTSEEDLWAYQQLPSDWTPAGWEWGYDATVPTNRSNEKPYVEGENFTTIIDAFIVSPNLTIEEVRGENLHFADSDHNPVSIKVKVKNP